VIDFLKRFIVDDRLICYNNFLFIPIEMGNSVSHVEQFSPYYLFSEIDIVDRIQQEVL
jgi:hypothetical protein